MLQWLDVVFLADEPLDQKIGFNKKKRLNFKQMVSRKETTECLKIVSVLINIENKKGAKISPRETGRGTVPPRKE